MAIRERITTAAPDITMMIANMQQRDQVLAEMARHEPTLIVSPAPLGAFKPRRGHVYQGRGINKLDQLERLAAHGIPTPRTVKLVPGLSLDPAVWDSHVIIKTSSHNISRGEGLSLVPTDQVRFREPVYYPEGHPARTAPLLVQQFIPTGPRANHYRINTLLGRPLYCLRNFSTEPMPDLATIREEVQSSVIASNSLLARKRAFELITDEEVMALASRCHAAFPDVPLKGVDIVRDHETGELYVLELNCLGNTWHISSNYFSAFRTGPLTRENMAAQLGAWDIAADVLIERTRLDAV